MRFNPLVCRYGRESLIICQSLDLESRCRATARSDAAECVPTFHIAVQVTNAYGDATALERLRDVGGLILIRLL